MYYSIVTIYLCTYGSSNADSIHCIQQSFFVLDVDECMDSPGICDPNANCSNLFGSYKCTCNMGYSGNGSVCESKYRMHYDV